MMSARHFLSLMDCTPEELVSVIRRGIELKDLQTTQSSLEDIFVDLVRRER